MGVKYPSFTCNPGAVWSATTVGTEDTDVVWIDDDGVTGQTDLFADSEELKEAEDKAWSKLRADRKAKGACIKCGELLEMTAWGLKECERCSD